MLITNKKLLIQAGRKLFVSCSLYDSSITPNLFTFAVVAPHHSLDCIDTIQMGLGINTMEGREQNHQKILQYSKNSTVQQRWQFIFRYEFIQLIYLKENDFNA